MRIDENVAFEQKIIIKIKVELGKAIKLKNLFSSHKHKNFPALDFLSFLKKGREQ